MSGGVRAQKIAVWCALMLMLAGGPGAALPAVSTESVQVALADAPEVMPRPALAGRPADQPFGLDTFPVTVGPLLSKWLNVEADIRTEAAILARCRAGEQPCPAAAQSLLAIVADGRAHVGLAELGVINRAINLAIRPTSYLLQRTVPDRWNAPLETLASGQGDCKDYAITKYVALREAGLSDDDVRLVIVHDLASGGDHAVVAVRLHDRWIMLDNRWLALVADFEMRRVIPLFELDQSGVKQFLGTTMASVQRQAAPASVQ